MQQMATTDWTRRNRMGGWSTPRRNLAGACLAHLLHDGYTDQLYALLPIWQSEFGLSYAGLELVRALYSGTMGGLQIPSDRFTAKLSPRVALALATFIAATGYLIVALPLGFPGLCIGLIIAGVGSSVQHPRASMLVTNSYGKAVRGPLSIYNFAGDLGKASFPAIVALLLPFVPWRPVVGLMAMIGLVIAFALLVLVPRQPVAAAAESETVAEGKDGRGFNLLLAIGAFDTATRMGYLLFLPFLFHAKGGKEATVGIGLALLFAGGALGKALARSASRRRLECDHHGSGDCLVHGCDVDVATRTRPHSSAASWRRSQRHVLGPLRDCSRAGAQRRGQPRFRAVLYRRHRRRGIGADRVWRNCRSFQQNDRRHCGFPHSGNHHPHGSCVAPFPP